jgi:L-seryl-tRNA(Ser) seleniumtransferase
MSIYDELGIRRVINGSATLTSLGGSLMPREVLAAMTEAASAFVDMDLLQKRVGEEIAALTHNEAAFVATGASAAIVLTIAACIAGTDPEKRARLPHTDGMKNEVIVQRCCRTQYDFAIPQAGGRIVEIGDAAGTSADALRQALTDRTAAVFIVPRGEGPVGMVPIAEAVDLAHRAGVPVIVDAAAQLPPPDNLWRYTRDFGADAALFSGGKGLCGPQASGLIVGTHAMVEACAFHASPRPFIGRPMKVGKEEMVGLYAAVKWYLSLDHDALMQQYEQQVAYLIKELSRLQHVTAVRDFPSEAGQPMPRAKVTLDEAALGITRDEVLEVLRGGTPSVELAPAGRTGIYVNPQTLRPGEERIIAGRLLQLLLRRTLEELLRSEEARL